MECRCLISLSSSRLFSSSHILGLRAKPFHSKNLVFDNLLKYKKRNKKRFSSIICTAISDYSGEIKSKNMNFDASYAEKINFLKRLGYALIERQFRTENCTVFIKGGLSLELAVKYVATDIVKNERRDLNSEVICTAGLAQGRLGECSSILSTITVPAEVVKESYGKWENEILEFDPSLSSLQILYASEYSIHIHDGNFPRDLYDPELPKTMLIIEGELDGDSTSLQTILSSLNAYAMELCSTENNETNHSNSKKHSFLFQNSKEIKWIPSLSPVRFSAIQNTDVKQWLLEEKQKKQRKKTEEANEQTLNENDSNAETSMEVVSRVRKWWKNHIRVPTDSNSIGRKGEGNGGEGEEGEEDQFLIDRLLPLHVMQIDNTELKDCNFRGNYAANDSGIMEVELTHSQIVDLANSLDLYLNHDGNYENLKHISSPLSRPLPPPSTLLGGFFRPLLSSVAIPVLFLSAMILSRLKVSRKLYAASPLPALTSLLDKSNFVKNAENVKKRATSLQPSNAQVSDLEMQVLCGLLLAQVKDNLNSSMLWESIRKLPVDSEIGKGAWLGFDLTSIHPKSQSQSPNQVKDPSDPSVLNPESFGFLENDDRGEGEQGSPWMEADERRGREGKEGLSNVDLNDELSSLSSWWKKTAIYQVVVTRDGNIIGCKPHNSFAIAIWHHLPLGTILHGKKYKASQSILENRLKSNVIPDDGFIVLELLVCLDFEHFSLTSRPWTI